MDKNKQIKQPPVGVKIISIIYYISAYVMVIALIFAIVDILASVFLASNHNLLIITLIISIILFLGFIALFFFVARGLWKGKNWARITTIILSIITIVLCILGILNYSFIFNSFEFGLRGAIQSGLINIIMIIGIQAFCGIGNFISYWLNSIIIVIGVRALIVGYLLFNKKVKEVFKE